LAPKCGALQIKSIFLSVPKGSATRCSPNDHSDRSASKGSNSTDAIHAKIREKRLKNGGMSFANQRLSATNFSQEKPCRPKKVPADLSRMKDGNCAHRTVLFRSAKMVQPSDSARRADADLRNYLGTNLDLSLRLRAA
jgi:hypothetical protein